jgi:hypothetical protein
MASITNSQLSLDMNHAINDFGETLTVILPTAQSGTTFSATRTGSTLAFVVTDTGRQVEVDATFFINLVGLSTYPEKGWVFSIGTDEYKVMEIKKDPSHSSLRLDCVDRSASD